MAITGGHPRRCSARASRCPSEGLPALDQTPSPASPSCAEALRHSLPAQQTRGNGRNVTRKRRANPTDRRRFRATLVIQYCMRPKRCRVHCSDPTKCEMETPRWWWRLPATNASLHVHQHVGRVGGVSCASASPDASGRGQKGGKIGSQRRMQTEDRRHKTEVMITLTRSLVVLFLC